MRFIRFPQRATEVAPAGAFRRASAFADAGTARVGEGQP